MTIARNAVARHGVARNSVAHAITQAGAGGGGAFVPDSSFYAGAKGVALDLTDMSKLYQDRARTTLVTATGQPIGSPTDLSGNNAHPLAAADNTTRPTFDGWATFDGSNDGWATSAIDFTGTSKITVVASIRKSSDAATGTVTELSANANSSNGSFYVSAPNSATTNYGFLARGTAGAGYTAAPFTAPVTNLLSCVFDLAGGGVATQVKPRVDAAIPTLSNITGTNASGTVFGNHALFFGRRGLSSLPLNGRIYRIIVIGRELSADELASAEAWCAEGAGLFF